MSVVKYVYEEVEGELISSIDPKWSRKYAKLHYKHNLKKSGIPENYWGLDFKDYHGDIGRQTVLATSKSYASDVEQNRFVNLYMFGKNRTQKSLLACAIGKEFIRRGKTVKFVLAGYLINLLMKNQGFNYHPEIQAEINTFSKVDLLIIDDAFDPNKSLMWQSESKSMIIGEWDTFIRNRISQHKRVIVTSNLSIVETRRNYGQSLYALLNSEFYPLEFKDSVEELRQERLKNGIKDNKRDNGNHKRKY